MAAMAAEVVVLTAIGEFSQFLPSLPSPVIHAVQGVGRVDLVRVKNSRKWKV
jgi:hypothetical protein